MTVFSGRYLSINGYRSWIITKTDGDAVLTLHSQAAVSTGAGLQKSMGELLDAGLLVWEVMLKGVFLNDSKNKKKFSNAIFYYVSLFFLFHGVLILVLPLGPRVTYRLVSFAIMPVDVTHVSSRGLSDLELGCLVGNPQMRSNRQLALQWCKLSTLWNFDPLTLMVSRAGFLMFFEGIFLK